MAPPSKLISLAELAKHNTEADCWVAIRGTVFDVTKFVDSHPGGAMVLVEQAGKDATSEFDMFHSDGVFDDYAMPFAIGVLDTGAQASPASPTPVSTAGSSIQDALTPFGNEIPYCDPAWYQGFPSPYYNASHVAFRARVRAFIEKEVIPNVHEWDESYTTPREITKKMAHAGLLAAHLGPPWPTEYCGSEGPENYDAFHGLILADEIARCASGGVSAMNIGAALCSGPLRHFGSSFLKEKYLRPLVMGDALAALAISEPSAGSDVANIGTTAVRQGDHFVVNGSKKWITGGVFSDFFVTAVRTGGEGSGMMGLSLLVIDKNSPGVKTQQMKCMGLWASGTTFITFDNVKVPVANLLGEENQAFRIIMFNFNGERYGMIAQAIRFSRICFEDSFKYALKRKTFGKRLIDHQAIRLKLATMARRIEATQSWLEAVTFQLNHMPRDQAMQKLGPRIALMKVQATQVFELCAREACQIFGGASYVRGGVGERVERLYREVRGLAIPGGSEEILSDFAMRMSARDAASVMSKL